MQSVVRQSERAVALDLSGWVVSRQGNEFLVRVAEDDFAALRAASCLMDPRPGDHVLLCSLSNGRAFILAVLERGTEETATITIDGDVALKLPSGRFEIVAEGGLGLSTAGELTALSATIDVQAADGHFRS